MVKLGFASFFCILGIAVGVSHTSHKLPDSFPRCHKKDPNFEVCLKKALDVVLPQLYKGVPSLGVFPLEPLMITALDIGNSNGGAVSISLKFRDLIIRGLSSIKLINVKTDVDNYKLQFQAEIMAPLILEGKYEADGKVLILPVRGKGDCKLKLDNVKATLALTGKERKKDGVRYMDVKDTKLNFETSRLHLHFEKLLGHHSAGLVGDSINNLLNENWKDILEDLKPGIEEGLSATFQDIASRVFTKVPYDQIFL